MKLKELAASLGLSPTTVSRALNGYPEVNAATRTRILEAAAAADYRPNTRAKGLATGRSMAIGHVIPTASEHEIVNPIFADFIAGAATTYAERGYEMMLTVVADGNEAQLYRNLKSRGAVDGVVLHAPRLRDPRIPLLDEIGLPFAVHGRASGLSTPYVWLDVNNAQAFRCATDHLLDLGHTRIALLNGLEYLDFAHRRRMGHIEALRQRGLDVDENRLRSGAMTETFGYLSTRDLLACAGAPTAFLVSSIICAFGARRAIEEAGLVLGRDVSVITHDDALSYLPNGDAARGDAPVYTAMRSPVREAGARLARMLVARIENPQAAPQNAWLEAELVMGMSTGPCRTAQADHRVRDATSTGPVRAV